MYLTLKAAADGLVNPSSGGREGSGAIKVTQNKKGEMCKKKNEK